MRRTNLTWLLPAIAALIALSSARAANAAPTDFQPDPKSVQRYGPAYRYPQAGWIVLHIEGEPYERGYQHGRLLAPEIAAFLRCSAGMISSSAPAEGWRTARLLIDALFVRRYEREYLEEMKGIADGAAAAGVRFDNRPIDLVDVVGLNVWAEIETLGSALEATPTGLEGMRFPHAQPKAMPAPKPMHCSAFAATAPATADGKIVFGHITMFGLYPAYYYNVWIDVKPAKGNRVIIQGYPGGIQSGLDYYFNDKGILVTETTIAQTRFDINGQSVASRIRQALQYADTIDKACEILKAGNNGLYTNEWLLADTKTNEIAMFELGTHKSKLYRSSKGEWPGGTEGFYWGCNNTKDLEVRLETIPGVNGRPANMVFCPSDRDKMWLRLFEKYKGKIDVNFAKEAFTTPPLAAYHSLDAKFTTSDLAKDLKSWALFGPPLGHTWEPSDDEKRRHPDIRPLVGNPWTILRANPPAEVAGKDLLVADIPEPLESPLRSAMQQEEERTPPSKPAWHGTLLAKTDADIWLATAFADYERLVAHENTLREKNSKLSDHDRDQLAVDLYSHKSRYLASGRAFANVPLAGTRKDLVQSDWYNVASGKGVLLLQELRRQLGHATFDEMMDTFGRDHAGKEVTAAEFQAHAEKSAGKPLSEFFDYWLQQPVLPTLHLDNVRVSAAEKGYKVEGTIMRDGQLPQSSVELQVATAKGNAGKKVVLNAPSTPFVIETKERPQRLIVDKFNQTPKANGGVFTVQSFHHELEQTLIVYGTADEVSTNREAAEALQKAIIQRHSNYTVPVKTDKEVTEDELKSHHVLLIGRPDSNPLVQRFQAALPITFGSRSFNVRNENYAHAGSAVVVAAENPLNPRFSLVVAAGLSPESTLHAAPAVLGRGWTPAEVVVLPNHGKSRSLALPARELVKELGNGTAVTRKPDTRPTGGQ